MTTTSSGITSMDHLLDQVLSQLFGVISHCILICIRMVSTIKVPDYSASLGFLLYCVKAVNNVHCSKCHLDEINAKELHLYGEF